MTPEQLNSIVKYSLTMKSLPRTGWLVKGIKNPESLADHSNNVTFISLMLIEMLKERQIAIPNVEKTLKMALIHDLPESIITDIPSPVIKYFGKENKLKAEVASINKIFEGNESLKGEMSELFWEFESQSSVEARIVRAADKLDMIFMVRHYEDTGARNLEEFWVDGDFIFENLKGSVEEKEMYQAIYKTIKPN